MPKVALVVHGILAIIFILLAVVLIANYRFKQSVREVEELFKDNLADKAEIVRESDLSGLPTVVRKWLEQSGWLAGKESGLSV